MSKFEAQSLSVVVPAPCLNKCRFCVSHMHADDYKNQMNENLPFYDLYLEDYVRRIDFARDNDCNTVMLTGNGEPLLNRHFLQIFSILNKYVIKSPFHWIELQTSGTTLDDNYCRFLRNTVWVNVISLSVSDIFSSRANAYINRTKQGFEVDIPKVCESIKKYDFTLRLSLNLCDNYENREPHEVFDMAKALGADQVTLRVLYASKEDTPESRWVMENALSKTQVDKFYKYIVDNGKLIGKLPYGASKYSINGMSVVLDNDCMNKEVKETAKYMILRPDCKLYSQWDDPASLIF